MTGDAPCANCSRPAGAATEPEGFGVTSSVTEHDRSDTSQQPARKHIKRHAAVGAEEHRSTLQWAQQDTGVAQDTGAERQVVLTAEDVRQNPVPVPWVFTESAAAQWLGTPLVFGFPIKSHMHAVPRLRAEVAAAEAVCTQATAHDAADYADAAEPSVDEGACGEVAEKGAAVGVGVGPRDVILEVTSKEPGLKQRVGEKVESTADARDADQKAGFVADVSRMHDVCADNTGCVVRWVEGKNALSHSCTACTQSDLIAGALRVEELIASGDGAVFYEKLLGRFSNLWCIRSTCCGSVVVQEFAWCKQRKDSLSPVLPEGLAWKLPQRSRRSCRAADVHAAVPATVVAGLPSAAELRQHRMRVALERYMKPATSLLEGSRTYHAWLSKCATCSIQLQAYLGCWSYKAHIPAPQVPPEATATPAALQPQKFGMQFSDLWRWNAPEQSRPLQDEARAGGSEVERAGPALCGAVFAWPFDDPEISNIAECISESPDAEGNMVASTTWAVLVSAAMEELLPLIEISTTVAELWAAVLHLIALQCGASEVVSQQLQVDEARFGGQPPITRGRGSQRAGQEREAAEACCAVRDHWEHGSPFCCREASFESVWGRRIDGSAEKVSRGNLQALFAADEVLAPSESAEGRCRGALALQGAWKCGGLPGRLITGYKTVYACATKKQATDLTAQLERSRVLLRLNLCRSSSSGDAVAQGAGHSHSIGDAHGVGAVGVSAREILGLVVIRLRALGSGSNLQLLHVQTPCWFLYPSVTCAGTVTSRVAAANVQEIGSSSDDGFASLHDWVVLPVGQSSSKAEGKNSVHDLRVDQDTFDLVTAEVKERVKQVLDDWQ